MSLLASSRDAKSDSVSEFSSPTATTPFSACSSTVASDKFGFTSPANYEISGNCTIHDGLM